MNRIKGLYRSWAIPCAGQKVYSPRYRSARLKKLRETGRAVPGEMVVSPTGRSATIAPSSAAGAVGGEPQTSGAYLAPPVPWLGPVRVTLLIALIQTPHRFRTRRQLWAYSGLALETRVSGNIA